MVAKDEATPPAVLRDVSRRGHLLVLVLVLLLIFLLFC